MTKLTHNRAFYPTIAALTLTTGLAGAASAGNGENRSAAQPADRETATEAPADASSELGLEDILARLQTAGYFGIREIEREYGRYEVKGRDAEGRVVELHVDARTGAVIGEECDD